MIASCLHVSLNMPGAYRLLVGCLFRSHLIFVVLVPRDSGDDTDFASVLALSPTYSAADGHRDLKPSAKRCELVRPEGPYLQPKRNETWKSRRSNEPRHHKGWRDRPRPH